MALTGIAPISFYAKQIVLSVLKFESVKIE